MRPKPSKAVLDWLNSRDPALLFTTAITEAEMLWGVELKSPGRKRDVLAEQVRRTFAENFAGRILPFDSGAAREFPTVAMLGRRMGNPILEADARIAAIVRAHGALLATRDTRDFAGCGIEVVNPWSADVR